MHLSELTVMYSFIFCKKSETRRSLPGVLPWTFLMKSLLFLLVVYLQHSVFWQVFLLAYQPDRLSYTLTCASVDEDFSATHHLLFMCRWYLYHRLARKNRKITCDLDVRLWQTVLLVCDATSPKQYTQIRFLQVNIVWKTFCIHILILLVYQYMAFDDV